MNDFENKIIKVNLNNHYGYLCISGRYIKSDSNFLVILDNLTNKIHYLCMYNIKSVEIIKDIGD